MMEAERCFQKDPDKEKGPKNISNDDCKNSLNDYKEKPLPVKDGGTKKIPLATLRRRPTGPQFSVSVESIMEAEEFFQRENQVKREECIVEETEGMMEEDENYSDAEERLSEVEEDDMSEGEGNDISEEENNDSSEEECDDERLASKGFVEKVNDYLESMFSTHEEQDEEIEEELSAMFSLLWKILSGTLGLIAIFVIITKYPIYLHTLHENHLWFSNIKEVEREISFRTEQGLYYSYYKQILDAPTLTEGFNQLTVDNRTENGRTINIFNRFNILPEITLSVIHRWLRLQVSPIIFYVWSVFGLHGVFLASLYATSWYISGSIFGGALTVLFFVIHRMDTTRVNYTIPLRESFAVPLLFLQILVICTFLRSSRWQVLKLSVSFLLTLSFLLSWQFGPFILLCQLASMMALCRLHLLPTTKVRNLILLIGISLLMSSFAQDHPPLIISSPVLSMVIPAFVLSYLPLSNKSSGIVSKVAIAAAEISLLLLVTLLVNVSLKNFLNIDADSHVYQLLLAKLQMGNLRDFDSRLYMCNEAFHYLDVDTLIRLSESGLLPIYGFCILLYAGSMLCSLANPKNECENKASACANNNNEGTVPENEKHTKVQNLSSERNQEYHDNFKLNHCHDYENPVHRVENWAYNNFNHTANGGTRRKSILKLDSDVKNYDLISQRPDLVFFLGLSIVMGILALLIMRLKVLWLPMVCVLTGVSMSDMQLYNAFFGRTGKLASYIPSWLPEYSKMGVCCAYMAFLVQKYWGPVSAEIWPEEMFEFWDPDTVELMEWIQSFTPPTAVFAGSMQLLAGVKLCTNRHIANHPHYEDGWLRNRTHQVYQIYGRSAPEEVHSVLKSVGATHIILEDSICMAPPNVNYPLCRLIDIVDLHYGHMPDDKVDIPGLKMSQHERFCDIIRYNTPPYSRLFSLVMSNKTFRVYRVAKT